MIHWENNVKTTTVGEFSATQRTLTVSNQGAPLNPPPDPTVFQSRVKLTLANDAFNPSNVEVISYNERSTVGGNWILLDVNRGEESTSARSWPAASVVFQSITRDGMRQAYRLGNTRNMIDNAAMNVNQRADYDRTQGPSGSNAFYIADRWRVESAQEPTLNIVWQREKRVPNAAALRHSLKARVHNVMTATTQLSGAEYYMLLQRIEGYDIQGLLWGGTSGNTATLSFWGRTNLPSRFNVAIRNGQRNRCLLYNYFLSAASSWQRKTFYIPPDSSGTWPQSATSGLEICWNLVPCSSSLTTSVTGVWMSGNFISTDTVSQWATAASATWNITGVDFRVGKSPPIEFIPNSYEFDLAKCKRYYEHTYEPGITPGVASAFMGVELTRFFRADSPGTWERCIRFSTEKRNTPTFSFWSPVTGTSGRYRNDSHAYDATAGAAYISRSSFVIQHQDLSGSNEQSIFVHWAADSEV